MVSEARCRSFREQGVLCIVYSVFWTGSREGILQSTLVLGASWLNDDNRVARGRDSWNDITRRGG